MLHQMNSVEARALVGTLAMTSRRDAGQDTWRHTGRCGLDESSLNSHF